MAQQTWYLDFLEANRQQVISRWFERIQEKFQKVYNLEFARQNGHLFLDLISEIHIPIEIHPQHGIIQQMCQHYAESQIPITHLLESSYMWRWALLTTIQEYLIEKQLTVEESISVIIAINQRIDRIQKEIAENYVKRTTLLLQNREHAIHQLHSDRLALLGEMAASMAHELRNPLFAIEGFLKLIKAELPLETGGRVHQYIAVMEQEFSSLYGQITGFLSFSRKDHIEEPYVLCSAGEMIEAVLRLIRPRLIDEHIEIEVQLTQNPELVIQRVAMQQVLSNLLRNAIDALRNVPYSKRIRIECTETEKDFCISVEDNGTGIPEAIRETLFTPFVTGKSTGTGLGLSVCKQIMEKNRGRITFTSRPGKTVFTVALVKDCGLTVSSPERNSNHKGKTIPLNGHRRVPR